MFSFSPYIYIHDSKKNQSFISNEFNSIKDANNNRFITFDSLTGNVYAMAQNNVIINTSLVQLSPTYGFILEYASFSSFSSTSTVEDLVFVNKFVYIMSTRTIYRVQNSHILPISTILNVVLLSKED
jgi:hypothetical protein